MAEAVISPIATYVLEQVTSILHDGISSLYGVGEELVNLKDTVSSIQAVLRDADEKRELSHQEEHLVVKLKDVLYDADDLLDLVSLEAAQVQEEGHGTVASKAKKAWIFFSKPKLAKKVKQIRKKIDLIAKDMTIRVEPGQTRRRTELLNRETISVEHEHVIGRDEDVAAIKKLLLDSDIEDDNVSFIAIVGIGGLGKTTLARRVFNDAEVMDLFKNKIWVCVSDEFDIKKIHKNIIQSAGSFIAESSGMEPVQRHLQQLISEQKYLLILDDVWSEDDESWKILKAPLLSGGKGSKILLTTRNIKVGNAAGARHIHPLKGLSEDDSWELFQEIIFQKWKKELNDSELIRIGKQIVKKCAGVPLAIKTISALLSNKTHTEWQSFEKEELSRIIPGEQNVILSILRLSFYHLQPCLKHCFAFCSLFPKDNLFSKEALIRLWIAQGFIHTTTAESLEDTGNQYLMHLLYMSFFQEPRKDSLGNIVSVKMHDLIHDLAIEVAKPEYLFVDKFAGNRREKVRHVSSEYGKQTSLEDHLSNLCDANRVRTLLYTRLNAYSSFKHLRALALAKMDMKVVPESICELKSLRYLDISWNKFETVPDFITSLIHLQTLDLTKNEKLKKLPKDLKKLRNLRHLVLNDCSSLICMPREIGKLCGIQTLSMFVVDDKASSKCSADISELAYLNNLRGTLKIKNSRAVESKFKPDILKDKKGVTTLGIDFGECSNKDITYDDALLEGGLKLPNLKVLEIYGYNGKIPNQGQNLSFQLPMLVNLEIIGGNCNHLPDFGNLPNLKAIEITNLPALQEIPPLDKLPLLKTIRFWDLNALTKMSSLPQNSCLESITLDELPALQEIPPLDKLNLLKTIAFGSLSALTKMPSLPQNSSCLESIHLNNLRLVEYIQEEEYYISSTSPTNSNSAATTTIYSPLIFPKLKSLQLWEMPNLMGWWKKVNPSSSSSSSSSSLSITPHFPLLSEVDIENCPNLMCMPFFPNIEVLNMFMNWNGKLIQQIEQCTLKWVINNSSSNDCNASSSSTSSSLIHPFSKVEQLEVTPESVEYVAEEGLFRHFTSLKRLKIDNVAQTKDTLPKNLRVLRGTLQQLEIFGGYLKFMPEWIAEFTSLQKLTFEFLKQTVLPQGLDQLTSLKQLWVLWCGELTILPETITSMTSLQVLEIVGCPKLESLPDGLPQLTYLQELHISSCPILRERCRVNEGADWPKIAHIPRIKIELEIVQDKEGKLRRA